MRKIAVLCFHIVIGQAASRPCLSCLELLRFVVTYGKSHSLHSGIAFISLHGAIQVCGAVVACRKVADMEKLYALDSCRYCAAILKHALGHKSV